MPLLIVFLKEHFMNRLFLKMDFEKSEFSDNYDLKSAENGCCVKFDRTRQLSGCLVYSLLYFPERILFLVLQHHINELQHQFWIFSVFGALFIFRNIIHPAGASL